MADESPMMRQYRAIKANHRDEVLFFRLGDFYEMFAEDAQEVSALLNLTLTSRHGIPMCGIPWHAARNYIARLVKHGKKIAICEQVGDPATSKGIVERRVVELITPGTAAEEAYLDRGDYAYLASIVGSESGLAFSYLELSSSEFKVTSFRFEEAASFLAKELERLKVREIIVQESLFSLIPRLAEILERQESLYVNRWADWLFDPSRSKELLQRQFGTLNLKAFGLVNEKIEAIAAASLLSYVGENTMADVPHIQSLSSYREEEFVNMDEATLRNLELVSSRNETSTRYTLFGVLDNTKTAMGQRLLKRRILQPLVCLKAIESRLEKVDLLYRNQSQLSLVREELARINDLERLTARVAMEKAHAKDLVAVRKTLDILDDVLDILQALAFGDIKDYDAAAVPSSEEQNNLNDIRALLAQAILDEPSILLNEGNMIRPGYDEDLDRLLALQNSGQDLLMEYLEEEKQKTGIANLKIKYNKIIGYFFEITKGNISLAPTWFIRRQSLTNCERYTTDKLAQLESDITSSQERAIEREQIVFLEVRNRLRAQIAPLLSAARFLADLDVVQSLARSATVNAWTRPHFSAGLELQLTEARHPVVEAHLSAGAFVPNDIQLLAHRESGEAGGCCFALITGPNMAGKSTYLRQTALIVLMAQMGSFVPASSALIDPVDRIFCRVGASDNLARGESTFLVEMNEAAYILRNATVKSLVIMDEVGRGTGTQDGLSIAWAICEDLLDRLCCRTLFATHYHELAHLEHPYLLQLCMDVKEEEEGIVFLKKVRPGAAGKSYGLHVARLAGIPRHILQRAREIMRKLEGQGGALPPLQRAEDSAPEGRAFSWLEEELLNTDVEHLSPINALVLLNEWQGELALAGRTKKQAIDDKRRAEKAKPEKLKPAASKEPELFD